VQDQGTVTAIIPTYDRRDLVVESVRSVLRQTYSNLRCLVVDNGSTDGTGEALTALGDPRLTVVAHQAPLGAAGARNMGILAAGQATWLAFLDNDDLWAPSKLERQLAALAASPGARWSATSCLNIGPDLRAQSANRLVAGPPSGEVTLSSAELLELLREDNRIPAGGSSVLASADLVAGVGAFNLDVPSCEDWDLWLRLGRVSPLAYVDEPLVAYRMWEGQVSTDVATTLSSAGRIRGRYFPGCGPLPPRYLARRQEERASRHLDQGQRLRAARDYVRATWGSRDPRKLGYALAAAVLPSAAVQRRREHTRAHSIPAGWEAEVEAWLGASTGAQARC
jgi:glycosyltransferase involved in cell wall biosynthesis